MVEAVQNSSLQQRQQLCTLERRRLLAFHNFQLLQSYSLSAKLVFIEADQQQQDQQQQERQLKKELGYRAKDRGSATLPLHSSPGCMVRLLYVSAFLLPPHFVGLSARKIYPSSLCFSVWFDWYHKSRSLRRNNACTIRLDSFFPHFFPSECFFTCRKEEEKDG